MKRLNFSHRQLFNSKQLQKYLTLVVASGLIVGCGGEGQDFGKQGDTSTVFSGIAVDGYLARSTVFIDSNNNGTRDAWEAFAFTDNDGYYSYNPLTDTNYCAAGATAQEAQYCLVSNIEYTNVVIRIDGGYDVLTGEPFLGQMSRRVNAENSSEIEDSIVSPITSLLSDVESESERDSLLTSMGIEESDLDVDYLNTDGNGAVDSNLLNTALKIHKVVAVLSDRLTDTYTEIGEDFGTPNDASRSVYPNLAEQIISAGTELDVALANEGTLVAALDAAETELRAVYEQKEFALPTDMGSVENPGEFSRVVEVASEIGDVVNNLIDTTDTTFSLDDATGTARALEALVIKAVNEPGTEDTSIDNAIEFFNNEDDGQDELVEALVASLSMETADVSTLSQNNFGGDDFDSVEEIVVATTLGDNVTPFTVIGGLQVRISDLDLGSAPNNLDDAEVELYFNGGDGDIDGSFKACVKFIDGASTDGTLGDGNTRGELVDGFWSLLGAQEENIESYSLLLTLTFLGTTYQAIMKPAGMETVGDIQYHAIRFDNDGELATWHSELGLTESTSLPQTNQECEERLPSRIGI